MPAPSILPATAGIGLRSPHVARMRSERPRVGWLEVHSENYFVDGGPSLAALDALRADYPVSLHGVGMSLGSADPLDAGHIARLKRLILPLPFSEEALGLVCERVDAVQSALNRPLLVENISAYIRFADDVMSEWEFVAAVARRTGCKLLLDVSNIHVNAVNHGFDAHAYLEAMPGDAVAEIHLGGFDASGPCLIDTHGARVAPPVWDLYRAAIKRLGPKPTLIEWDTDIPALEVLLDEAAQAQAILEARDAVAT
ncbi:MAG: DUF692 domain-containing protein [Betaproteobacteria bacterium]|nr:MAG: DUF692 domain-containing protein [Betaproteobacteria bacterium]